jgi:hypothetical protein
MIEPRRDLLPGVGPTTAARIQDEIEAHPRQWDALLSLDVPKAAAEDWPGFAKLIAKNVQSQNAVA